MCELSNLQRHAAFSLTTKRRTFYATTTQLPKLQFQTQLLNNGYNAVTDFSCFGSQLLKSATIIFTLGKNMIFVNFFFLFHLWRSRVLAIQCMSFIAQSRSLELISTIFQTIRTNRTKHVKMNYCQFLPFHKKITNNFLNNPYCQMTLFCPPAGIAGFNPAW